MRPQTLRGYIRTLGGLWEPPNGLRGELRHLNECCAGLVNRRTGIPLDRAREAACERGYLGPCIDMALIQTTPQDLLDALHEPTRYSAFDAYTVERFALKRAMRAAKEEEANRKKQHGGWRPGAGRKPIGDKPMTQAEKWRRWRDKRNRQAPQPEEEIPF